MPSHILISDAQATDRIKLRAALTRAGYQVQFSENVKDILHSAKQQSSATLIVGQSTDRDTIQLIHDVRTHQSSSQFSIIYLAHTTSDASLALKAGADDAVARNDAPFLLPARLRAVHRAVAAQNDIRLPTATEASVQPTSFQAKRVTGRVGITAPDMTVVSRILRNLRSCRELDADFLERTTAISGALPHDVILLAISSPATADSDLEMLSHLRSIGDRNGPHIIVQTPKDRPKLAAQALDLGAHDIVSDTATAEELHCRLRRQICIKRRLDAQRNSIRQGLAAATRDPLTGLHNRRYAMPTLARAVRAGQGKALKSIVMLADIDHFKAINDRFGHRTGDQVIKHVSKKLRQLVPAANLVARIGGEEFLIVLEEHAPENADTLAAAVCQSISSCPMLSADEQVFSTSISVGVGYDGTGNASEQDLLDAADRALYRAKASGRNQVCWENLELRHAI